MSLPDPAAHPPDHDVPRADAQSSLPQGSDQPRVPDNRWDRLEVPSLGAWEPQLSVSVVVPAHDDHDELPLTLAALGAQTYPDELLDIVVVDDGSDPPLEVPDQVGGIGVRSLRQEQGGFGAGRARHAGGEAATGDVVLFVDADVICDAAHVEAHARWHHAIDYAVTMGMRTFVDVAGITADEVAAALAYGGRDGMEELLADREQQPHEWIERLLEQTNDLRARRADLWRVAVGSSIAVPAWLLAHVGGFPVFGMRGTEDTAFGQRLFNQGAVLVPDREAHSWHQGPRFLADTASKEAAKRSRRPVLANHVPGHADRRHFPGRTYAVPDLVIDVPVDSSTTTEEEAVGCVEALLADDVADAAIGVTVPEDDPLRERLTLWFEGQDRVSVTDGAAWADAHPHSPIRVMVPPRARTLPVTLGRIRDRLARGEYGALHILLPGVSPADATIEVVTTRARRRTRCLAADAAGEAALVGELFGERWEAGEELGVRDARVPDADLGIPTGDLASRLAAAEEAYLRVKRRRVVRITDALGSLARARRPGELLAALRGLARALVGRR